MAFEKKIAHHLYSAYEAYLDLKVKIQDAQHMRVRELQDVLSKIPTPELEETGQGHDGYDPSDHHGEHAEAKKKPLTEVEKQELQVHLELDLLGKQIEALVQLLTQHHTTSPTMLGEFENLRTFKVLTGTKFLLGPVLPLKPNR